MAEAKAIRTNNEELLDAILKFQRLSPRARITAEYYFEQQFPDRKVDYTNANDLKNLFELGRHVMSDPRPNKKNLFSTPTK